MINFAFEGAIPTSKSLVIRSAVCGSYVDWKCEPVSADCDDIKRVKAGLESLKNGGEINCGESAAVFRFLTLRASREIGEHKITGTSGLFSRPQNELLNIFEQLGISSRIENNFLTIKSNGWPNKPLKLSVDRSISSQFVSGLVLNSWKLNHPIEINWMGQTVSDGYFDMTLKLVQQFGMRFERGINSIRVFPNQIPITMIESEPDMSSAFALAAIAAVGGECRILDFPSQSLQPDSAFINILDAMGVPILFRENVLVVKKAHKLLPVGVNLKNTPDLFPVLAVLCAFADGKSELTGAPHLIYKESNRLQLTCDLLDLIGRDYEKRLDGLVIFGKPYNPQRDNRFPIYFEPENDHRLVMAAAVARQAGFLLRINNVKSVDKSFPQFKEITNLC